MHFCVLNKYNSIKYSQESDKALCSRPYMASIPGHFFKEIVYYSFNKYNDMFDKLVQYTNKM